ncbi:MAG: endonuclease [Clostridia bacterium]|nr:endonuclease [Clostridia bacterium]
MRKALRIIFRIIVCLVIIAALCLGLMTAAEYRPKDRETLVSSSRTSSLPKASQSIRILSWNTGYGALGDNADFFMDGGKGVITADTPRVLTNIGGIVEFIKSEDPDLILLQEVDLSSKRSSYINQTQVYRDNFPDHMSSFAYNYRALYVPYPLPTLGKVESGLQTLSRFGFHEAERISLPCPFSWPVSTVNLKRCLLVTRIPVSGTEKELVVINLHLEAYDSGEGKTEQTRILVRFMQEEYNKGNYVIAGGDFNQLFSNIDASAYPVLENRWQPGLIDASAFSPSFSLLMDSASPTCRSLDQPYSGAERDGFQYYLIDGFIVSDNVTVASVETRDLDFVCSDHNPVIMTVSLN